MCSRKRRSSRTVLTQVWPLPWDPCMLATYPDTRGSAPRGPDCDTEKQPVVFCDRISSAVRGHHPTTHPQASSLPALSR